MENNIRNLVIIAHIDHGKSTLADRMLELTGTVQKRLMKPQYLDSLELERERGITIKMAPVRMLYERPAQIKADVNTDKRGLLYEDLTHRIREAVFNIYNQLGPSFKEGVYGNALKKEFERLGLHYEREKNIDINYDGKKVGNYRPDFTIEDKILLEIKALPFLGKLETKQAWYCLKGSKYRLALLVNFGSKEVQIERIIYDNIRNNQRKSAKVERYVLNLIDTPGHSDFSYEVSRALAAVEGAILLVDATQGIQAQTLANFENAKKANLTIIGAVNKIDAATEEQISDTIKEIGELIAVPKEEILRVSGKTGEGVEQLLENIIEKIPPPVTNADLARTKTEMSADFSPNQSKPAISRALVFDSYYDEHKGIIAFVRVFNGDFKQNNSAKLFTAKTEFKIKEIGYFSPELKVGDVLENGNIGYIATGLKDSGKLKIGDTVFITNNPQLTANGIKPLPGYSEPKPVVFVSFYPEDSNDYEILKQALGQLKLNDSALVFEPDFSEILGRGFKGGFLGRLHFEITADRIKREFKISTVHSFPSVTYQIKLQNDGWLTVTNPKDFTEEVVEILEPMTKIEILTPPQYLGTVLKLKEIFRLADIKVRTSGNKSLITAKLPLADLISDLDDKLKSVSEGFASLSYESAEFVRAEVSKMEILVATHVVPGLTRIVPKKFAEREARRTVKKLKELLPRQQFAQAVQARVQGRIIARETISALRKDVTGYLYGGDRTRKMKLWKKQKKGKKRLQERSETAQQVKIPASIFKELLKK